MISRINYGVLHAYLHHSISSTSLMVNVPQTFKTVGLMKRYHYFEKLTGVKPQHINYHHHYDFYKNYPYLATHLFQTYHLPMRLEREEYEYPIQ